MICDKIDCKHFEEFFKDHCRLKSGCVQTCEDTAGCYYHKKEDDKNNCTNDNLRENLSKENGIKINDKINHPSHYTYFQKEVIDIIQDCLTPEEFKGYLKGNLIKYRMRAGLKDNRNDDLDKSNYYQDRLKGIENEN